MTSKINPDSHSNTFDQSQVSKTVNNADTISSSSGNISTSNTASIEPIYLNTDSVLHSAGDSDIQSDVFSSDSLDDLTNHSAGMITHSRRQSTDHPHINFFRIKFES
jgi:hypothetical protein